MPFHPSFYTPTHPPFLPFSLSPTCPSRYPGVDSFIHPSSHHSFHSPTTHPLTPLAPVHLSTNSPTTHPLTPLASVHLSPTPLQSIHPLTHPPFPPSTRSHTTHPPTHPPVNPSFYPLSPITHPPVHLVYIYNFFFSPPPPPP